MQAGLRTTTGWRVAARAFRPQVTSSLVVPFHSTWWRNPLLSVYSRSESTVNTLPEFPPTKSKDQMRQDVMSIIDRWFPNQGVKPKRKKKKQIGPKKRGRKKKGWVEEEEVIEHKPRGGTIQAELMKEAKAIKELLLKQEREPSPEEAEILAKAQVKSSQVEKNLAKAAQSKAERLQRVKEMEAEGKIKIDPQTKEIDRLAELTKQEEEAVDTKDKITKAARKNSEKANKAKSFPIQLLQTKGEKQGWLYCASSATQFQDEFEIPRYRVVQLCKEGQVKVKGRVATCFRGFMRPDEETIKKCQEEGKVIRVHRKWDSARD